MGVIVPVNQKEIDFRSIELQAIKAQLNKKCAAELAKADPLIKFYDGAGRKEMPITFRPNQVAVIQDAMRVRAEKKKLPKPPRIDACTYRGHPIKVAAE